MSASTHDLVEPLLGPAALGALDAAERDVVDRHLARCPDCAAELRSLSLVAGRLSALTPEQAQGQQAPEQGLSEQIVLADARRRRSGRRRSALLVAAAAIVLGAAGAGGALLVSEEGGSATPISAGPVPVPVPVQTVAGVQASAGMIAHTWGVEIKLIGSGFTNGDTYAVQLVNDSGQRSSAGRFLGTGQNVLRCNLTSGVLSRDAAAFIVRDDDGRQVVRGVL